MKIGILTLHEADSYGAVLQAYALQRTLKKLGADNEFLSFAFPDGQAAQAEIDTSDLSSPLIRRIRLMGEQRSAFFTSFRREHLVCAPVCPQAEAEKLNSIYDCFITGSDQVWNMRIPGVDGRYFLPFAAPEKRYSYAASFGSDELPERVRGWCGGQLSGFRGLSVREESGRRLVRELTGRDAAVCLDPTLLLDPGEWDVLAGTAEEPAYVLLFLLQNNTQLVQTAREYAYRNGLDLRVVTSSFFPQFGFEPWSGVGVEQWLSLIRDAECVFTNSFHGAVFSALFARPLRVERLTGQLADRNGRMEELLRKLGLETAFDTLCPPLSHGLFAERIANEREVSINYLKGIAADGAVC